MSSCYVVLKNYDLCLKSVVCLDSSDELISELLLNWLEGIIPLLLRSILLLLSDCILEVSNSSLIVWHFACLLVLRVLKLLHLLYAEGLADSLECLKVSCINLCVILLNITLSLKISSILVVLRRLASIRRT